MNDIGQIVTAIQGNPIKREILGVEENNYVLTWSGVNDQWEAKSSGSDSNPGIKYNVKTINTYYSIQANIDSVVFVFTDSGAITVTLPAAHNDGDAYIIKDWSGYAVVNTLTVNAADGAAINGTQSIALTNPYEGYTFTWLQGKWNTDTYQPIFSCDSIFPETFGRTVRSFLSEF